MLWLIINHFLVCLQELLDIRKKLEDVEISKIVVETDFKEKYDSVLRDKLQELRDEFEEEASNIRLEVENSYKSKVFLNLFFSYS